MRVLAIESSCDETAAAIVSVDDDAEIMGPGWRPRVESQVVASQIDTHTRYGGVVPELASRAHLEAVLPAIKNAMIQAGVSPGDLDGIGVTRGPGLVGALLVGLETAKALAYAWKLPITGVHHLVGHIYASFFGDKRPELPFICLLVSGGHSALYEVRSTTELKLMGQTRDDAAGEAFDKGARMMGLPYPGGVEIDKLSESGDRERFTFPIPMQYSGDLDFSFSGLKTALRQEIHGSPQLNLEKELRHLCASYQEAIAKSLVGKTKKALESSGVTNLVVAGGVAANRRIRSLMEGMTQEMGVNLSLVPLGYCTDNAAMIGAAALGAPPSAWLEPGNPQALTIDANPSIPIAEAFSGQVSS